MIKFTGLTAERMEAIEAQSVVDAELSGDNLILKRFNETTIDVGNVRGPMGEVSEEDLEIYVDTAIETYVDTAITELQSIQTSTPVITSSGGTFDFGSTATLITRYNNDGIRVFGSFVMIAGGSGITTQSGAIRVSLPVNALNDASLGQVAGASLGEGTAIGTYVVRDASAPASRSGVLQLRSLNTAWFSLEESSLSLASFLTSLAAGDCVMGSFSYWAA